MSVLSTLFPVFFMIALGLISRIKGWITPQQKEGASSIVFNILFPILVFNVLFTSTIESSAIFIVLYIFIAYLIILLIGKKIEQWTGKKYAHFSRYLLITVEGGNVALPLYTSIVGAAYASNTVIFDLAGTILAFIVIPIIIAKKRSGQMTLKELICKMFSSSFIVAVFLGLLFNVLGVYQLLLQSIWIDLYTSTVSSATAPIVGMIMFIIGYDLKIDMNKIAPLMKLICTRVILFICIIIGFFILFADLMAEKTFMIAVLLYFMCPTGFAVPMIISPLFKDEDDNSFSSAFISLFMIVTLVVYTVIVVFIA